MEIDANTIGRARQLESTVCIIGAGPAGLTIAHELARYHIPFIVLESGGFGIEKTGEELLTGENVGLRYSLVDTRARCFGGSASKWVRRGARMRPMDPIDFTRREGTHQLWPIHLDELLPYYERAYSILGIEDCTTENERACFNAAVESSAFHFVRKSRWNRFRTLFQSSRNQTLVTHASVRKLQCAEDGCTIQEAIVSNENRQTFVVRAKHFVLATGGIENARLLLLSNDVHREGIGNQDDMVGRYFMEHMHCKVGRLHHLKPNSCDLGYYIFHRRGREDLEGFIRLRDEVQEKHGLLNASFWLYFTPAITDPSFLKVASREMRSSLIQRSAVGSDLRFLFKNALRNSWRKSLGGRKGFVTLHVEAEQSPHRESRVSLSRQCDSMGLPKARVDWKIADADLLSIQRSLEIMQDQYFGEHLGHLDMEDIQGGMLDRYTVGAHHIGTTRMSQQRRDGVVDPACRVHGVYNLYVAGSSVFPTCGAANPTLTIMALAARLAKRLHAECRDSAGVAVEV